MKKIIDENSEFRLGDEIYNPKIDEYFKIVTSCYKKIYGEIIVFFESSNWMICLSLCVFIKSKFTKCL